MGAVWTLAGAVLGALVAGLASLYLAWRTERRAARAGQRQLKATFEAADAQVTNALDPASGVWWPAERDLSTATWDTHQHALVAQLPGPLVATLEAAVRALAEVNALAAISRRSYDADRTARAEIRRYAQQAQANRGEPNPAKAVDEDKALGRYLAKSKPATLAFDDDDREKLDAARTRFREAGGALEGRETRQDAGRILVPVALVAVAVVAVLVWHPWSDRVTSSTVANAVRVAVKASLVDCDPAQGQSGRWWCTALYGATATCPTGTASSGVAYAAAPKKACGNYDQGSELYDADLAVRQKNAIVIRRAGASDNKLEPDDSKSFGRLRGLWRTLVNDPDDQRSVPLRPKPAT